MHHILNARADSHKDFCEDAYYYTERDGWVIAAVFDGCSDSINSHFASQLFSYSLRGVIDDYWMENMQNFSRTNLTTEDLILSFCSLASTSALCVAGALRITALENLSTAVVAMYDTKKKYLMVKFLGDGVIRVNGEMHRVESGEKNEPNYVGYLYKEDFDEDPQLLMDTDKYPFMAFTEVSSFSICTDGIDAIKHPHRPLEEMHHYLLEDKALIPSAAMLRRKLNILKKEGAILNDDLTIIRYEAV